VQESLKSAFPIKLGGEKGNFGIICLAVVTQNADIRSKMGHELAILSKKNGFRGIGCIAYIEEKMNDNSFYKVSLRSVEGEDTTIISKYFGGGGHQQASSFSIKITEFDSWKPKPTS